MSTKKVFVTTLSTLRPKPARKLAYYCVDEKGAKKYFTGISTNEPGAKYLLSTENIDKLVVIGSDKTHGSEVSELTSVGKMDYRQYHADPKNESAYAYLLYRLSQYFNHMDIEAESLSNRTPTARKAELESLVQRFLAEHGYADPDVWFEVLAEDEDLEKDLQALIRKNIQKDYADPKDYEAYAPGYHYTEFPELSRLEEGELSIDEMIRELRKMEDEAFSTFLDKELFLTMGLRSLDNRISALEREKLEKRNEALTKVIEKLRVFNVQLQIELRDIKQHREEEEISYAKYYLFRMLGENRKLSPLPSTGNGQEGSRDAAIEFVPLKLGEMDNISGIISAISGSFEDREPIKLYIDVQGGGRTDAFIRNQIFSVLANETGSRITIEKIISVDFETRNFANNILDETNEYKISDLVSGMNAFTNYGKAGTLSAYLESLGIQTGPLYDLVQSMLNIDTAIALCDIQGFEDGIGTLRNVISVSPKTDNQAAEYFSVLRDGIRRSYGRLVTEEKISPPDLIRWCSERQMIQQALTLYTEKMPIYYFESGLFEGFVRLSEVTATLGNSIEYSGFYTNVYEQIAFRSYMLLKEKYAFRIIVLLKRIEDLPDNNQKKQRTLELIRQIFLSDKDPAMKEAGERLIDIIKSYYNNNGHLESAYTQPYGGKKIRIEQKQVKGLLSASQENAVLEHFILINNDDHYAAISNNGSSYKKKMPAVSVLLEDEASPYKRDLAIVLAYYLCVKVLRNRMNHAADKEQEEEKDIREFLSELSISGSNGKVYRFAVKESIGDIQALLSDAVEASQLLVSHAPEVSKMLVDM